MTRDEILSMPAGRELDAAVAELVMGWEIVRTGIGNDHYISPSDNSLLRLICNWKPSENIADAWRVVEKMPNIQIAHVTEYGYWRVAPDYHEPTMFVIADTPELAICRAALLAVNER